MDPVSVIVLERLQYKDKDNDNDKRIIIVYRIH